MHNTGKQKLVLLFIAAVFIVGLSVFLFAQKKNSEKSVESSPLVYMRQDMCSEKLLQSVSGQRPTEKNVETSIQLLNFRASCLSTLGKNQEAISVYKQLITFYKINNDQNSIENVQDIITDLKAASGDNTPNVRATPDASPELVKAIQKL